MRRYETAAQISVIPAKAGIQGLLPKETLDPRLRGDDKKSKIQAMQYQDSTNIQQHSTTTRSDLDEFNPQ